jgi:maltose-binding protein MalE
MAVQWNAFYGELTDPAKSPKVYDKFDISPPPGIRQADGTIRRQMYVQTIGLAINRNSVHKREAMRFLTWASLGEGAEIYAQAGGSSPVDRVWKAKNARMPYPKLALWVEAYGRSPPNHPKLTDLMMIGSGWIQRVIMGDVNSEQAALGMYQEMAAALGKSE